MVLLVIGVACSTCENDEVKHIALVFRVRAASFLHIGLYPPVVTPTSGFCLEASAGTLSETAQGPFLSALSRISIHSQDCHVTVKHYVISRNTVSSQINHC